MNIFDYIDYEDSFTDHEATLNSVIIGFENIHIKDDIPGTTIKKGTKFTHATFLVFSNILTFHPWQKDEIKLRLGHVVVYEKHGEGGRITAGVKKVFGECAE